MKVKHFFITVTIIGIASLFSTNMAYAYPWLSPYAYCMNNPVKFVDPDGKSPIYDPEGNFLGTDDEGLHGTSIVMSVENFTQGMAHKDASNFYRDMNNEDAYNKMNAHYNNLPNRPDYDGFVTIVAALQEVN